MDRMLFFIIPETSPLTAVGAQMPSGRITLCTSIRIGVAAVTLLLLGACATAPVKVTTLFPPTQDAVLPALQNPPSPVSISEEMPSSTLRPAAVAATTPPIVAAAELIVVEPAPVTPVAPPDYIPSFASYYAKRFAGRRTASGECYDPDLMTAATRDFPLQSWLKVINPANGREVIVRINDRTGKRKTPLVDLSRAAAKELGFFGKGKIRVHVIPVIPAP
jgi:rare lipoprotein A